MSALLCEKKDWEPEKKDWEPDLRLFKGEKRVQAGSKAICNHKSKTLMSALRFACRGWKLIIEKACCVSALIHSLLSGYTFAACCDRM